MQKHFNSVEFAQSHGSHWGENDASAWQDDFAPQALIEHPFFQQRVTPLTASEVMNSTVCGTTEFDGCRLIGGDGSGQKDLVEMHFVETGRCAGYKPLYHGRMVVFATIANEKITHLKVKGYDLLHVRPTGRRPFQRVNLAPLDATAVTKELASTWANNDMERFVSMFSTNGVIIHPLFTAPITPEIAADVLNSAMKGQCVPHDPKLLCGDGSGEDDVHRYAFRRDRRADWSFAGHDGCDA